MLEPSAMDRENVPLGNPKEKKKRRSSILKKRSSSQSPSRTPLSECAQDRADSPSRKKRNLGERRVSFSRAPEVREFARDHQSDFPPRISPHTQPIAGIESLLAGNLMLNLGVKPSLNAPAANSAKDAAGPDEIITGDGDFMLLEEPGVLMPAGDLNVTIAGPVDMSLTCVPSTLVTHPFPATSSVPTEDHDMSLTEVCLAEPTQNAARPRWGEATCNSAEDMETTCVQFPNAGDDDDDDAVNADADNSRSDMEMTCNALDATCRQIDESEPGDSPESDPADLNHVLGFIESLKPASQPRQKNEERASKSDAVEHALQSNQILEQSLGTEPSPASQYRGIAPNNATMTCMDHVDMSEDLSADVPAPVCAVAGTGASLNLDMMSLSDAASRGQQANTAAGQSRCDDSPVASDDQVQESAVATPHKTRAGGVPSAFGGLDETAYGLAASTPVAGGTMGMLQSLDETLIRPVDKLPIPLDDDDVQSTTSDVATDSEQSVTEEQEPVGPVSVEPVEEVEVEAEIATDDRSLLPAASCVADTLLAQPEPGTGIENEEPPSFLDASELAAAAAQQVHPVATVVPELTATSPARSPSPPMPSPQAPAVPMANLGELLVRHAEASSVYCEFPEDLVPTTPYEQWTCAEKLFCTFAGKPLHEILEYGTREFQEVNSKLLERLLSSDNCNIDSHIMPEDVADAHASYIVGKAELEASAFQAKLLNRYSQQLRTSQQRLDTLMQSLSVQCEEIDKGLQLLDAASSEVEDACQWLRRSQISEEELQAQDQLISEVKEKHSLLVEARDELEKCELDRARLINEKDQLQQQATSSEAALVRLAEDKKKLVDSKAEVDDELEEAAWRLNSTCRLQEWRLMYKTSQQAKVSFLCDTVVVCMDLQQPTTMDGVTTVTTINFEDQPGSPSDIWEEDWSDFAAVLFLDSVEALQESIVQCQTIDKVLDLLSPLATAARMLVEQCWTASLHHTATRDLDKRSVTFLFGEFKPLHRFLVTFQLPCSVHEKPVLSELVSVTYSFGSIQPKDVHRCISTLSGTGERWLLSAMSSIHALSTGRPLPWFDNST
eukprot:scpid30473/ scgid18532/ 